MFNRKYIFKGSIFHCYVRLPECIFNKSQRVYYHFPPPKKFHQSVDRFGHCLVDRFPLLAISIKKEVPEYPMYQWAGWLMESGSNDWNWGMDQQNLHEWPETNSDFTLEKWLVGGWTNPFEKYDRQNGFIFPKVWDENKTYLKPPPRNLW